MTTARPLADRRGSSGASPCPGSRAPASHAGLALTGLIAPALSDAHFDFIRTIARRHSGIVIADFKRSMVLRRLRRRLQALSLDSIGDYCDLLAGQNGATELQPLINVLTTNKTAFFREEHHFKHLTRVAIPELVAAKGRSGQRKLRIWSAGCSTGEEVWSIAMSAHNAAQRAADWDIQILASDIDTEVLATARLGCYRENDLECVPFDFRKRYFQKVAGSSNVEGAPALRRLVNFKSFNLNAAWPFRGQLDVIFCRNVVIYFDRPTQQILYERFADALGQPGFLYCGHSESLHGLSKRFHAVGRNIYERAA